MNALSGLFSFEGRARRIASAKVAETILTAHIIGEKTAPQLDATIAQIGPRLS